MNRCLVVALAAFLAGCPSKSGSQAAANTGDARVEKLLVESKAEARAWLDGEKHGIFKLGNERTKTLVDDLYGAGCTEVDVTGITKMGEGELAAIVVGKMPATRDSRAKVIARYNDFYKDSGDKPLGDTGQKWIELDLD